MCFLNKFPGLFPGELPCTSAPGRPGPSEEFIWLLNKLRGLFPGELPWASAPGQPGPSEQFIWLLNKFPGLFPGQLLKVCLGLSPGTHMWQYGLWGTSLPRAWPQAGPQRRTQY